MEDQQTEERLGDRRRGRGEPAHGPARTGESKQFLLLGGEPILNHSVRRLLSMPAVAGVVVVLHPRTPCASPASSWCSTRASRS